MNYLMCSVGRRCELLKDFRISMEEGSHLISTDNSPYAPALYFADQQYIVPTIDSPKYVNILLDICKKEKINAITTLIDPEIMILSEKRAEFQKLGVEVLAPYLETAKLCYNKYELFKYLIKYGIKTPMTWGTFEETIMAVEEGKTAFPLFVKPRCGSGSVGGHKVDNIEALRIAFKQDSSVIAQEIMTGEGCLDLDADVYIDTVSHDPVAIFLKRKISTTIGGANKTISFKDERLFNFICKICKVFKFNGPIDADFFYKDGEYYLSEINPRFGGAYLHAHSAGVDFIKLIENNLKGQANESIIGQYDSGIVMMMYDSVVVRKENELSQQYSSDY